MRLLASVLTGPLDERVRDRLVAETRGNPLALLEFPHVADRPRRWPVASASRYASSPNHSHRGELSPPPRAARHPLRGCCCSSLQPNPGDPCRYGGVSRARGGVRGAGRSGRPRRVQRHKCASAIRSSDPRFTGPRRRRSASARTARWPTRRTRKSILTGARGTARTQLRLPTRTLRPSSSARPAVHRAAVARPRPRPFSSAQRS